MNIERNIKEISNAFYDHRFVTVNLTDGRSVTGRVSGMSDISFSIGMNPRNRNRYRIDRIESIKVH